MTNLGIKYITFITLFLLVLGACKPTDEKDGKGQTKPNIILFLVDDMGWQDTSVPFWDKETNYNRIYHTPGMERLASEGMRFTQAYATSVCSPTRVSLMTGMNAARHRVTNWTLKRNVSVDGKSELMDYPDWNINGLQACNSIEHSVHAKLLPQILKENGYYTIHCGKAHFGAMDTPAENPINCGFDVNIAGHAAGGLASYLGELNFGNKSKGEHTKPWGVPGLEHYHGDSIFLTEALTIEAKKAIDNALVNKQPFYLYMAHYAIHIPLNADKRFYQKYIEMGLPESEAKYASMIEAMDKSLFDLMEYVEEKQLSDNTIILFMSDNGGFSLRPRAGELHTHNKPLNSGKGSAYEGGIRVPMLVKWPGVTKENSSSEEFLIIEDFFSSILEMAGIEKYKTTQVVDGVSFVPILKGESNTGNERALYWHFPNNWGPTGPGIGATSAIRKGDWKLIYYYSDQSFELYNLKKDIGEENNLADEGSEKVRELAINLGKYLRSVKAQRPSYKSTGELIPWPDDLIN
ncbi:sulfatase [Carboxylicivirga sp. N1Y90]|uniref:sulfatase n=1 Tax=Carboxylicivirga fragile TaxID=3417571 RepID=UPI003D328890|nr:sulfatase [Marinilabiliaceae bacterium N1Y90]